MGRHAGFLCGDLSGRIKDARNMRKKLWIILLAIYLIVLFRTILCGFGLSLLIELLQFVFGTGVSEVDDLILNTLGTLIGFVIFSKIKHWKVINGRRE